MLLARRRIAHCSCAHIVTAFVDNLSSRHVIDVRFGGQDSGREIAAVQTLGLRLLLLYLAPVARGLLNLQCQHAGAATSPLWACGRPLDLTRDSRIESSRLVHVVESLCSPNCSTLIHICYPARLF